MAENSKQTKWWKLNKSAFNTEEFHCLDFLLLGVRNELCNLNLPCITYSNFTEYLYTVFIENYLIFIVVYIHVFC